MASNQVPLLPPLLLSKTYTIHNERTYTAPPSPVSLPCTPLINPSLPPPPSPLPPPLLHTMLPSLFPAADSRDLSNSPARKRYRRSTPSVAGGRSELPDPAEVSELWWGFPAEVQQRRAIFCIEPLEDWSEVSVGDAAAEIGHFSQRCFLCKKMINNDAYMFGSFRAFCSPECRRHQMDFEGVDLIEDTGEAVGKMRN